MSAGTWQEARHTDGRVYHWNTVTKETRWTKPEEAASGPQPWKEYSTPDGRKYYHNTETKATVWEMPEAYRQAQAQAQPATPAPQQPPQQGFVAGGTDQPSYDRYPPRRDRDDRDRDRGDDRRDYDRSERPRSNFVPATTNEPDYRSFEDAEAAFMTLMKKTNVQLDWSWDQAMRATIQDPQYRALKDPKERKNTFEKYIIEQRAQNKEKEKERVEKLRRDFTTMLQSHPEIKHSTRWKTARPIIEGESAFRSAGDDTERRQLFEEYVQGLRKQHAETEVSNRRSALDDLSGLLQSLDLEPYTRWSDAHEKIQSSERYQSEAKFMSLTKTDILVAFENHIKALERTFNDTKQLQKNQKGRNERQHRDRFVELLRDLESQGKIKAGTKWKDVRPLMEDDERYHTMLGQSGSTPLDLFWDIVEEQERALRSKRNVVFDVLEDKKYEITPKTELEAFMSVMQDDTRTASFPEDELKLIFERLHAKVVRLSEEDKHHAERAQRKAVDALRSRIRHLDPAVRVSDSWEDDVRPRLERYAEYRDLETDELRRSAFEKVIRRLKEKEADAEADRHRRADRDRDRDRTNGHRRGRGSRTPELDVYEADRRKAMAARERQYRKSSTTGLSPPPSESGRRRDRYDDHDRYDRGRLAPSYERDRRRPPDYDRERGGYASRADPRDAGAKELDYGDGRAGSMSGSTGGRRRRGSDADEDESPRAAKRARRDRASRTPAAEPVEVKEEEALKSGSEEGEIEEV